MTRNDKFSPIQHPCLADNDNDYARIKVKSKILINYKIAEHLKIEYYNIISAC